MNVMHDDFDPILEAEVRAELRDSIVPPATPAYIYDRLERLAAAELARPRRRLPVDLAVFRTARAGLAGVAAVLVIASLLGGVFIWRGNTPAAPTPRPSRSAWVTAGPPVSGTPANGAFWSDDGKALFAFVGDGGLHVSTDGGATWSPPRPLPAPTDLGLTFVDSLHGFTAWTSPLGSGQMIVGYRTDDGGQTWQATDVAGVPVPQGTNLLAQSHFADATHGVITTALSVDATEQGGQSTYRDCRVYRTDDGGVTWTGPTSRPCSWLVAWADGTSGWVPDANDNNAIWLTEDMGATWRHGSTLPAISSDRDVQVMVFQRLGPGHFRMAGKVTSKTPWQGNLPFVVYESTDGGVTWTNTFTSGGDFPGQSMLGISVITADHWIGLEQETVTAAHLSVLVETFDAGRTWSEVDVQSVQYNGSTYGPGPDSGFASGGIISFQDAQHGLLQGGFMYCPRGDGPSTCGGTGTYFYTDDGGRTWREIRV